jgi:predicted  nucleic acid-binding Zn-ribbon protein
MPYVSPDAKEQIASLKYRIASLEGELDRSRQQISNLQDKIKNLDVECKVRQCGSHVYTILTASIGDQ